MTYRERFDENAALEKKDGSGVLDARLVIGLSLAWEPDPTAKGTCDIGPGPDSVSRAVREALTFAAPTE